MPKVQPRTLGPSLEDERLLSTATKPLELCFQDLKPTWLSLHGRVTASSRPGMPRPWSRSPAARPSRSAGASRRPRARRRAAAGPCAPPPPAAWAARWRSWRRPTRRRSSPPRARRPSGGCAPAPPGRARRRSSCAGALAPLGGTPLRSRSLEKRPKKRGLGAPNAFKP